jgi:hypothetical protein
VRKTTFPPLNFPQAPLRIRENGQGYDVFDPCRLLWVYLSPEEWVRQHVIHYLTHYKKYASSQIHVEELVLVNKQHQRADIVVYGKGGRAHLLIECKAPHIQLSDETLWQVNTYNRILNATYMAITNGLTTAVFKQEDCMQYVGNEFPAWQ